MIDATTPTALAALVDSSTFPAPGAAATDMTPRRITGARVVLEWVGRAWLTKRRALAWAPARGVDLRDLENATFGPGELEAWRQTLKAEAEKRPYVVSCLVAITLLQRTVTVDARLVLVDGKVYPLMMTLSEAAAAIRIAA